MTGSRTRVRDPHHSDRPDGGVRRRRTLTRAGRRLAGATFVLALIVALNTLMLGTGASAEPDPGSNGPAAKFSDAGRAKAGANRPNIVVVSTDDQTLAAFNPEVMPRAYPLLAGEGTNFTDAIVVTPVCCPSRATYLTGQYGHNHGILTNNPGYPDLKGKRNTLPVWMQEAGYRTVHVGKYLNNYDDPGAPPGWDDWRSQLQPHRYYRYDLGINGRDVRFGDADEDYVTTVLTDEAVDAIDTYVPERRPLFLTLDYFAPHNGVGRGEERCRKAPTPGPQDQDMFNGVELPRPPSFNERDVSDKPSFIRRLDPIDAAQRAELARRYGCTLASLREVDRGIERIYDTLAEQGELENTVFVFWSDNGFFNGEHRLSNKKQLQYDEGLKIPLAIRVGSDVKGGGSSLDQVDRPVANIDLAPTILDYAKGEPCRGSRCRPMDGLSMKRLIRGKSSAIRRNRPLEIEFDHQPRSKFTCTYQGVRTPDSVYIQHLSIPRPGTKECRPTHEVELYDLKEDPYQLENLAPAGRKSPARSTQRKLRRILDRIRDCRGVRGRDPKPKGGRHFCGSERR